jgi:histone H3/H4
METQTQAAPVAQANGKVRKPTIADSNEYGFPTAPLRRLVKDIALPVDVRINPIALDMIRDAMIAYAAAVIKESLRFVDNRKAQTITEGDVRSALASPE